MCVYIVCMYVYVYTSLCAFVCCVCCVSLVVLLHVSCCVLLYLSLSACLRLSVTLPTCLVRPCAWPSLCAAHVGVYDCATRFAHSLHYCSATGQYIVCILRIASYMYTCAVGACRVTLCFWDIACAVHCLLLSRIFSCTALLWQTRRARSASAPMMRFSVLVFVYAFLYNALHTHELLKNKFMCVLFIFCV